MTKYLQPIEFRVFQIHQGHQIFILPCPTFHGLIKLSPHIQCSQSALRCRQPKTVEGQTNWTLKNSLKLKYQSGYVLPWKQNQQVALLTSTIHIRWKS